MKRTVQWSLPFVLVSLVVSCGEKKASTRTREDVQVTVRLTETERMLRGAHFVTTLQRSGLSGRIRSGDRVLPLGLSRRGGQVRFSYQNPEEGGAVRLHSRWTDGDYEIFEVVGGKVWACSAGRLGESVGGTGFTHEDLMMPWLLWRKGVIVGSETIEGQEAWKIRVRNPDSSGQYREVEVWIHREHGVLLQAVCYDQEGRARKRFVVDDVQRVADGGYAFRRGRLDHFDAGTQEVRGVSYLEFDKAALVGAVK